MKFFLKVFLLWLFILLQALFSNFVVMPPFSSQFLYGCGIQTLYISNEITLFGKRAANTTIDDQEFYWFIGGCPNKRRHKCSKFEGVQVGNWMHSSFSHLTYLQGPVAHRNRN